jgi:hypothetical protein
MMEQPRVSKICFETVDEFGDVYYTCYFLDDLENLNVEKDER